MGNELVKRNIDNLQIELAKTNNSLSGIDKTIIVLNNAKDLAPAIQDLSKAAQIIATSLMDFLKVYKEVDSKVKDNIHKREILMEIFDKQVNFLHKLVYKLMDKIDLAEDEKTKDSYQKTLLDIIGKADNISLQLMKNI